MLLCKECQLRWNENPVGIMHRDKNLCKSCKEGVLNVHQQVIRNGLFFFENANKKAKLNTVTGAVDNALAFAQLSKEQQDKRRADHENETLERVKWCLDKNLEPAHDWLHLSCGDDSKFMFGIPPWFSDGSINPAGVAYGRRCDGILKKELQICQDDNCARTQNIEKNLSKGDVRSEKLRKAASGSRKLDTYAVTKNSVVCVKARI
jgi:hypothetical protein